MFLSVFQKYVNEFRVFLLHEAQLTWIIIVSSPTVLIMKKTRIDYAILLSLNWLHPPLSPRS